MNFFIENWLLIAVAFVSGGMLVWPLARGGGGAGAVGASEAVRLMNREKAALIDVSEPREFGASHAAQARNVPIGQLETSKDLPHGRTLWPCRSNAAQDGVRQRESAGRRHRRLARGRPAHREVRFCSGLKLAAVQR